MELCFKPGKMITPDNKIIQSLWIGKHLSYMELLTLKSFVAMGHSFHLYCYDTIETPIPTGVIIKNAEEILPKSAVFSYKHRNQFGHGKGSFSGFSDIFRYKLLYEKGGWYTDMDLLALKPLNLKNQYFFRKHHVLPLVGNVMKAPPHSAVMLACFEEAYRDVNADNQDWHKPIEILAKQVFEHKLDKYIVEGLSNLDWFSDVVKFYFFNRKPPENWHFIHWTNENFRANKVDKSLIRYQSFYGKQLINYEIIERPKNIFKRLKNEVLFALQARKFLS